MHGHTIPKLLYSILSLHVSFGKFLFGCGGIMGEIFAYQRSVSTVRCAFELHDYAQLKVLSNVYPALCCVRASMCTRQLVTLSTWQFLL